MRKQFVKTIDEIIEKDQRLVVLLGDIGVFGFRKIFADHPTRIYNIGILEQSMVSMASGLAMTGFIPVLHTIAPFLVERCYEQLKLDFGYQKLGGNFVSVGASYDYAELGCSHHCPGDVGILKNIPGMSILVPGTAREFDILFRQAYANNSPNYYRLSETANSTDQEVSFGKACIVKRGLTATIIAVGPILQNVLEACADMDLNILYYTTIFPFDNAVLGSIVEQNEHIIIIEPYYSGSIIIDVMNSLDAKNVKVSHIGVPREFLLNYGTKAEHDQGLALDSKSIREKVKTYLGK